MGINGASSPASSTQSALVKHRYGPTSHKRCGYCSSLLTHPVELFSQLFSQRSPKEKAFNSTEDNPAALAARSCSGKVLLRVLLRVLLPLARSGRPQR